MARMIQVLFVLSVRTASAGWKHRQLFQAEAPSMPVAEVDAVLPLEPAAEAHWQRSFEDGLSKSKAALSKKDGRGLGHWVMQRAATAATGAAVPADMLRAEQLMGESLSEVPESSVREKQTMLFATRLYHHAKWLAERQHATAAEERYLRCKRLALEFGNEELAAHALSRFGYFLTVWGREDEARKILTEAVGMAQSKPNNVASFLLGKLERNVATSTADLEKLLASDSRILTSQKVPSQDLEAERLQLISEIRYWQEAEMSLAKCMDSDNFMHILICGVVHVAQAVHKAVA